MQEKQLGVDSASGKVAQQPGGDAKQVREGSNRGQGAEAAEQANEGVRRVADAAHDSSAADLSAEAPTRTSRVLK